MAYTTIMPTPETVTIPNLAKFRPGRPVTQQDLADLSATLNYVYGRQGARAPGMCFDPYWSSLAFSGGGSSYHSVGIATNSYNLDDWSAIVRFNRRYYDTVSADHGYSYTLSAFARNLNLRLTMRRLDTEDGNSGSFTDFQTIVTNHSATDSEWQSDTLFFDEDEASRSGAAANGLAFFLIYLEAQVPASGSGQLWTFGTRETIMPTSGVNLPRSQ